MKKKICKEDSCDGKQCYDSKAKASQAAYLLKNKGNTRIEMVAYKCAFCDKYHFGHSRKSKELKLVNKPRRQKKKLDPKDYQRPTGT